MAEGLQISFMSFIEFVGSQLGVITPLLFVLMSFASGTEKRAGGIFLFWFSVPVIVFFLLKSIQAKVQANWALPGYITAVMAFSAFYMREFIRTDRWRILDVSAA